jgi:Tripartite tricarboxylate transporter TctB family
LLFLFFGLVAVIVSRNYPMGSSLRMGPGYFPVILGGLLTLIGMVCCVRSLFAKGEVMAAMGVRPLLLILSAVGVFAISIESAGIVVATVLSIVIAALASRESRMLEVVALTVFMLALAVGVFTYALGLPFKVFPG